MALTLYILPPSSCAVGWLEAVLQGGQGWVDVEGHQETEASSTENGKNSAELLLGKLSLLPENSSEGEEECCVEDESVLDEFEDVSLG